MRNAFYKFFIFYANLKGTRVAEFEWESSVQGLILSSFTFLAWVTPIFTYSLCRRFGAKTIMLAGMLTSGCLTMLMPLGARLSPYALITMRVIVGFALVSKIRLSVCLSVPHFLSPSACQSVPYFLFPSPFIRMFNCLPTPSINLYIFLTTCLPRIIFY